MLEQYLDATESRPLRGLIAWLSVCILTAAWGPRLEPSVRSIWASVGSFGLAAAVALDLVGRMHRGVKKNIQKKAAERRIERSVARISIQNASSAEIGQALQAIAADDRLRAACPRELRSDVSDS